MNLDTAITAMSALMIVMLVPSGRYWVGAIILPSWLSVSFRLFGNILADELTLSNVGLVGWSTNELCVLASSSSTGTGITFRLLVLGLYGRRCSTQVVCACLEDPYASEGCSIHQSWPCNG